VKDTVTIANINFQSPTLILIDKHANPAGIIANLMQGGLVDGEEDGSGNISTVPLRASLSNIHVYNPIIKGVSYEQIVGTLVGEASLYLDVNTCSVNEANISAPQAQVGGIVGKSQTSTNIHACLFTGTAEGKIVGGITSEISSGEPVYNCRVDADLYSNNTIGGIVGFSGRSLISNCVVEGTLTLDAAATAGKVGGIVGEVETDATGNSKAILVENNLVGLSAITVPEGKDVIAHRVVGFSSGDNYEYDWDNIDWNKPQSEWPRVYFPAEKGFKNNYVYSDLAGVDATIQLTDTTTEGATIDAALLTQEWLGERGFLFGTEVAAPWVLNEEEWLTLWFEAELTTDLEEIVGGNCGDVIGGEKKEAKKLLIDGQLYILRPDGLYNATGVRLQ
jgi:hypothetical protein